MLYNLKNAGLMAMVWTAGIKQKQHTVNKKNRNGKVGKDLKFISMCVFSFLLLFIVRLQGNAFDVLFSWNEDVFV